MKRMLSIAVVTVGVTGLLGTGLALAQSMSMSGSGNGAGSGGGAGIGAIGGWSLAPEPTTKKKPAGSGATASNKAVATNRTTTSGAWSVAPTPAAESKPAPDSPAPATVASNSPRPALAPADARNSKVEVKNLENGVTITFTSTDRATAARLQKMAEAMRLMHEAMSP